MQSHWSNSTKSFYKEGCISLCVIIWPCHWRCRSPVVITSYVFPRSESECQYIIKVTSRRGFLVFVRILCYATSYMLQDELQGLLHNWLPCFSARKLYDTILSKCVPIFIYFILCCMFVSLHLLWLCIIDETIIISVLFHILLTITFT